MQPLLELGNRKAAAALTGAATAALLWLVTHIEPLDWPAAAQTPVTLGGEHYRVSPSELEWLESFSTLHFSEGEQGARDLVEAQIDARLDAIFSAARGRLPEFADWYYSLRGEYSRLAMAALSLADLAEADYVAQQAATMLFPAQTWDEGLARLQQSAAAQLRTHQAAVRAGWLAEISRQLERDRVPPPLASAPPHSSGVDLDRVAQALAAGEQTAFNVRISVSTIAAAGAAAAGAAAARGAAATGRAAAARVAGRGAARAGAAAAGGATICAATGPGALACALIAGAAVWLGADWALLTLDEHLNREDLLAALEKSLEDLRGQVETSLRASYDEVIAGQYGAVREEIRSGFVPAAAGAAPP